MKCVLSALLLINLICGCSGVRDNSEYIRWGDFKATLTESGELHALNSKMVNMPDFDWQLGKTKVIDMRTEGTLVKKGEYIAQVDTSSVIRILVQSESDLAISHADYQKLEIEQRSAIRQLESELQSAQAALRLAEIDTLSVQFESKAKREQSHIQNKMCILEIEKLEAKIKYDKQIQREEKFILEEKIKNYQRAIRNAHDTITRFTLHAPADGMIEYRSQGRPRRKISIGDEFWPGEPIIGLPDLSKMKAAIMVNERDIKKITPGQSAMVRLDAFPQKAFPGAVSSISKMCHAEENNLQIKVFDVEILLEDTDPILKPGMTISSEISIAELQEVFYVPTDCVHEDAAGFCIYVEREGDIKKITTTLGSRNTKYVVVYGDLLRSDILLNSIKLEQ